MTTIGLLLFAFLAQVTSQGVGVSPPADTSEHKPCVDLKASPASKQDAEAFERILAAIHVDLDVHLYVSHDSILGNHGGAMSFRCPVNNHEIYETDENWTVYDPDFIQGDAARDFVFAHEIAHHLNGDTYSRLHPSKEVELRADYNGANYLLRLGWSRARLLHALDLLNLPQTPQLGYPALEERKAAVELATVPRPSSPYNFQGIIVPSQLPPDIFQRLLMIGGPVRFQSVRTGKYVCSIGTPDPKIPSTHHFDFFDNCEPNSRVSFALQLHGGPKGNLGYWIEQYEKPCPEYALVCEYVLEFVGDRLQFWNDDLAADREWQQELGEQELFSLEVSDPSQGLVRIKTYNNSYIFAGPDTGKLQAGATRDQAGEFKLLFDSGETK